MQIKSNLWDAENGNELSTVKKQVEDIEEYLVAWLSCALHLHSVTTFYFADEETTAPNNKSFLWGTTTHIRIWQWSRKKEWASWKVKVNKVLTMHASFVKISYRLIHINPQVTLWDVLSFFHHPSFYEKINKDRITFLNYNLQNWDSNPVVQLQNMFFEQL